MNNDLEIKISRHRFSQMALYFSVAFICGGLFGLIIGETPWELFFIMLFLIPACSYGVTFLLYAIFNKSLVFYADSKKVNYVVATSISYKKKSIKYSDFNNIVLLKDNRWVVFNQIIKFEKNGNYIEGPYVGLYSDDEIKQIMKKFQDEGKKVYIMSDLYSRYKIKGAKRLLEGEIIIDEDYNPEPQSAPASTSSHTARRRNVKPTDVNNEKKSSSSNQNNGVTRRLEL